MIRIITDEGITGWSQIETPKPYLQPIVLQLKSWLVSQDPVNVERVMRRIRVRGGFKPWGAAVSAIEMALWDIAGKAAGLPVYRRQGPRPRTDLPHALPPRGRREPPGWRLCALGRARQGAAGRLHHVQAADIVPFGHGAGGAGIHLRGTGDGCAVRLSPQGYLDRI